MPRTVINLNCAYCKKEFIKIKSLYDSKIKKGQKEFYCGQSCRAYALSVICPPITVLTPFKRVYCLSKHSAIKRNILFEITVEDIEKQWRKQNGVCPYTQIKLELPRTHAFYKRNKYLGTEPKFPSLDRIDSQKGYIKDNIEFVCLGVNLAKQAFSKDQMLNFFDAIRNPCKL